VTALHLAELSIAIATVAAIATPLILAATALVFEMVVHQAASIGQVALEVAANATRGLGDFTAEETAVFQDADYDEAQLVAFLQFLSGADFHPKRFGSADFMRNFGEYLGAFQEHLAHLRATRLAEGRARFETARAAGDADAMNEALQYLRVIPELERYLLPTQVALESFGRQIALYADALAVWRILRDDIRILAVPGAVVVVVALGVAASALTHSPTLIHSEALNLAVGLALLTATMFAFLRISVHVRAIAGVF
jgi:hypothetical protein